MKYSLGRFVYGLAVIACATCALVWRRFDALAGVPHRELFVCIAAITLVLGGAGVLWPRTARAAAAAVGVIYVVFALLGLPLILKQPLVYNGYGNVFEQLSLASGAVILYACSGPTASARLARIGYYTFGVCVISFALEQLFYLSATAGFVPKWLPPGQMFWAIATTVAFGLAAVALLTGIQARLAAGLTTAIIFGFLLLTWLPALIAHPHSAGNWSEATETLAIAATAWMVADLLSRREWTSH
ncbi:MAG TPA: hypothetical protein VIJ79_03640 [Acidobacteriaceae bacterium]